MRTAILFSLMLLLAAPQIALTQTYVSGNVGGQVWAPLGNPYIVIGNLSISAGDTLIMQSGCTVQYQAIYDLNADGVLLVNGTHEDSVSIYGAPPGYYDGCDIYLNSTQGQSHFQGGHLTQVKLHLGPTPTTIDRCTISIGIDATGSSNNSITNSMIYGWIHYGRNWVVTNNTISCYVGGSSYAFAISKAISDAQGDFEANVISASATASYEYPGSATAYGFYQCSGTIAHNTILTSASAFFAYHYGIKFGDGVCHHNGIHYGDGGISSFSGEIRNNTILNAETGIEDAAGIVRNCIIKDCATGFSGSFEVRYNDVNRCLTPYSGVVIGPGNIAEDPLLTNLYFLTSGSPCIDAGDPDPIYNDPDGTRNDMGANYFDQGAANVNLTLTPYGTPIQIPASGGSFNYNIAIANTGTTQVTGQVWCLVTLPDSSSHGPVLGPVTLTFPAGFNNNRNRTQNIPASAPAGNYAYHAYVGLYPDTHWDDGSFPFTKLTTGDGPRVDDWANTGDSFEDWLVQPQAAIPDVFALNQNYPNPFNPTTTITFGLPVACWVKVEVFDIAGRVVGARRASSLQGWYEAGMLEVTFDGSDLPSGIYLLRLQAGDFYAVKKMILLK